MSTTPKHEAPCVCGHRPALHTNYANGIAAPCSGWNDAAGSRCNCSSYTAKSAVKNAGGAEGKQSQ